MRLSMAALLSLTMLAAACDTRETIAEQQARVRNQPPAACTPTDFASCPALDTQPCADGSEPVIDYSSDCCPHFSCQPVCVAAQPCVMRPAPSCPAGTTLWIGTALEDCCPAYRCEPATECDATRGAACPASFPYCGPGVEPVEVGKTADCCPIYQCPCDPALPDAAGEYNDAPPPQSDPGLCGCTYPTCYPGEQLQCQGANVCGYPCVCVPLQAQCVTDADCPQYDCGPSTDCGVQLHCDTSMCLPPPGCDPASGMLCPPVCGGICVGNTTFGCKSDAECPGGQRCDMMCAGWGCAADPTFPSCECPPDLPTCTCDAAGNCFGEECLGQCVPGEPSCGGACAAPGCPNPIQVGVDRCGCPIFECTNCTVPQGGNACPLVSCYCAQQVGFDANCCPIVYCPPVTPPAACPAGPAPACAYDGDCGPGAVCLGGLCADATSAGT